MQTLIDDFRDDEMVDVDEIKNLIKESKELSKEIKRENYDITLTKDFTNTQRQIISSLLSMYPEGLTDLEICELTGLNRSSVTARRNEIPFVMPLSIASVNNRPNIMWGIRKP